MDNRSLEANASANPPAAPGAPSVGYPKAGNPQTNDPASKPGPYWFYMLGEEMRNVITAGGLVPAANNLTQVRDAIQAMINASLPADALVFKGFINCAANPNYPAGDAGHVYRVSVAGKIGGAGPNVEVGDVLTCLTDATAAGDHATVGANWTIMQANLDAVSLGAVIKDDARNLVIKNNPANVTGSLIITADEVILKNASGNPLVASNVAFNDFQYIAANMDDGGAPPTNAWTYVWLFSNGNNVVGKYSASPTAPMVPGGYSYLAMLAPWRVDGGAALHRMRVHGREESQYDVVFSGQAGPGGAITAQSLASFVPPMAKMVRLALGLSIDGATRWMQVRDTSVDAEFVALVNKSQYHPGAVGNVDGWYEFQETWLPLTVAQTVYWRAESTEAFYRMGVLGYRF